MILEDITNNGCYDLLAIKSLINAEHGPSIRSIVKEGECLVITIKYICCHNVGNMIADYAKRCVPMGISVEVFDGKETFRGASPLITNNQ